MVTLAGKYASAARPVRWPVPQAHGFADVRARDQGGRGTRNRR
jgi:hypothetical protein